MHQLSCSRLHLFTLLAVVAITSTGCASLNGTASNSLGDPTTYAEKGVASETFTVELRKSAGVATTMEFPLTETVWLNDAVELSEAKKHLGRMNGVVMRANPQGAMARMEAKWDRRADRFPIEDDFNIHPGDKIIFTEDTSNDYTDMLSKLLGPLAG